MSSGGDSLALTVRAASAYQLREAKRPVLVATWPPSTPGTMRGEESWSTTPPGVPSAWRRPPPA